MRIRKKDFLEELKGYAVMLLGCLLYGASTSLFLADNDIIAGGVTGLAVLIKYLNPTILIGMLSIALNLPILILGAKFQGWKFIIRCLITVATLGAVTDILAGLFPEPLTTDGVLASLYGGICQGVGLGLSVRFQFSTGGTELLGRVIARFVKALSIPVCVGILDGIIVVVGSVVTQNPSNMLHALIVVFLSTKVSEMVIVGFNKSKLCIVITEKGELLSEAIIKNVPRGVTMLNGKGMYTQKDRNVILTCVKKDQLPRLKQIVKEVDENAFIIINDSAEVQGLGFKALGLGDE